MFETLVNETEVDLTKQKEMAKEIEEAIQKIFPKSVIKCNVGGRFAWSISIYFTLGTRYANGIDDNDPCRTSINIWLNQDGSMADKLKVECNRGGGVDIKSVNPHYAYDHVKAGWRNFTCKKEDVVKKLVEFFTKYKEVIKANIDKMTPFDKEIATEALS